MVDPTGTRLSTAAKAGFALAIAAGLTYLIPGPGIEPVKAQESGKWVDTRLTRRHLPVRYYNSKTGYSATYDLDVVFGPDGKVKRIYFPDGGWVGRFASQVDTAKTVTLDANHSQFIITR